MVPVVFRHRGIRYYFFSNESNPLEPVHIHAEKDGAEAKLWLYPQVKVAESFGFSRHELVELMRVVYARRGSIERAWYDHFG